MVNHYSYNDIKLSYKNSLKIKFDDEDKLFKYIYRPISLWITIPFAKLTILPNTVTIVGFLMAIISFILFIILHNRFVIIAALFFISAFILDFVDGNLARLYKKTNYYGKFIDGLVDVIVNSFVFTFIGIHLELNFQNRIFTHDYIIISTIIQTISLFYSYYFVRKNYLLLEMNQMKKIDDKVIPESGNTKFLIKKINNYSFSILPILVFLLSVTGHLYLLLVYYFLISILIRIPHVLYDVIKSDKLMNYYRDL